MSADPEQSPKFFVHYNVGGRSFRAGPYTSRKDARSHAHDIGSFEYVTDTRIEESDDDDLHEKT